MTPLGSGSEVGRSCILLDYKGARVLLDCGIHPGLAGIASLPFFDEVDLATARVAFCCSSPPEAYSLVQVDVLLVTHFHLDHCAAVPFLVAHTPFKGRIFMTHATKAIYGMLLADFVKLNRGGDSDALFSDADLAASMARIETVDYHQVVEVVGIRITPYAAGHVLGAAMFQVDIAGLRVLYTGDYSRKADRHLPGAETPPTPPHVLIVESTYGVATHSPKDEREKRFTDRVVATLRRGGRVLLPIVALGRAQELLLILEDYWEKHPELQHIPVWQASGLARRSLSIYQTYIGMLNADMQAAFERANPFALKHVKNLVGGAKEAAAGGPCVVLATPSMLQTGLSRELFEAWAGDARNGVIIADFAVAGTLARDILGDAKTVTTRAGVPLPILCSVDAISFSAHADFPQTSAFVAELAPPHVVLVHGEAVEMGRLKRALEAAATADGRPCHVYTPRNCQPVAVVHKGDKVARVLGRLADEAARAREAAASSSLVGAPPAPPPPLRGLLVPQGFGTPLLLHPDDVEEFTVRFVFPEKGFSAAACCRCDHPPPLTDHIPHRGWRLARPGSGRRWPSPPPFPPSASRSSSCSTASPSCAPARHRRGRAPPPPPPPPPRRRPRSSRKAKAARSSWPPLPRLLSSWRTPTRLLPCQSRLQPQPRRRRRRRRWLLFQQRLAARQSPRPPRPPPRPTPSPSAVD